MSHTTPPANDPRPTLAIICNSLPPYRLHAHQRIAREIPEVRLLTVSTHVDAWRDWKTELPVEIGHVDLSNGAAVPPGWGLKQQAGEHQRGRAVIDLLRQQQVTAVIVNGYNDLGRLRIIRWCSRQNVPVFIWADSNIRDEQGKRGLQLAAKKSYIGWLARQVNGFFACGRLGRQFWENYGARPDQVFISPYEPDYQLIRSITPEEITASRQKHALSKNKRYIVFSGRLIPVKRVDLLIAAFAQIAPERPEWELLILGDGELREELESQVPISVKQRIRWLGFLAKQAEVSRLYRAADVLTLPSVREPWALVINEAVAAGMAIVSTDAAGAAAELVRDGVNGRVVPCADLPALATALRDCTSPENIDRYKAASQGVLEDWCLAGDPVQGIRAALQSAGITGLT